MAYLACSWGTPFRWHDPGRSDRAGLARLKPDGTLGQGHTQEKGETAQMCLKRAKYWHSYSNIDAVRECCVIRSIRRHARLSDAKQILRSSFSTPYRQCGPSDARALALGTQHHFPARRKQSVLRQHTSRAWNLNRDDTGSQKQKKRPDECRAVFLCR
jgi:hypothetical protein